MTTARDLCLSALRDSGVVGDGQTARADQINDAMTKLNQMLAQWAARRFLLYASQDIAIAATGAQSYGIGPGGDINLPNRPPRIDGVYVRQYAGTANANDYVLTQITSRDDYNQLALKSLPSMPGGYFYDNAFPVGNLFIWPLPSNAFELHVNVWTPLAQVTNLSAELGLPLEYEEPISYNLQVRLRVAYRLPPDPAIIGLAASGMSTLRSVNATVPTLMMPGAVLPRGPNAGMAYIPSWPY